jgi:hypothetical protein
LQCPVQRGPADLEVVGDGGDRLAAGLPGPGDGQYVLIDGRRAAAAPALGFGGAQPVQGALADQIEGFVKPVTTKAEAHLGSPTRSTTTPRTSSRLAEHARLDHRRNLRD